MKALKLVKEKERLEHLHALKILDTASEKEYDDLVDLASKICNVPISLISLVDEKRQWFKAKVGLEENETDRDYSFCAHAILKNSLFVVDDASEDPRFFDNPLVTNFPNIRFYAGAQLVSENGYKLGTLCVIDDKPRTLNWEQVSALRTIANAAEQLLRSRSKEKKINELTNNFVLQSAKLKSESTHNDKMIDSIEKKINSSLSVIQNELSILKGGKFTKKDIATVYNNAEQQIAGINSFLHFIKEYSSLPESDKRVYENLFLKNIVAEIFLKHEEKIKADHIEYTTDIPEELMIINNHAQVLFALQYLLQLLIKQSYKNKIALFAKTNKKNAEISINVTNFSEAENFEKYFKPDDVNTTEKNPDAIILTEPAMINDIINSINGKLEIIQTGKLSLLVTIVFPDQINRFAAVQSEN